MLSMILTTLMGLMWADQPNIVWISVEDMSPWISPYGDDTVPTPNLDRLAAEGVRYTHAYANTPVCAPARSTLITGMYPTTIGSMHMRTGNPSRAALARNPDAYAGIPSYEAVPPAAVRCFPEYLRQAGYFCTNRSKQDYQFNAPVTVWDESSGKAHWRKRDDGQPFFAVFNFTGTHESGTFAGRKRAPHVADPKAVDIPPYYPDTPTVRDDIARTYDNIAAMDARVGNVLKQLEDDGLLDETVVVFFSDHGVGLPRGKRCVYDSGTHVPLIIRWPDGAGAGTTEDRLVSFVDFAPTTLAMAGLDPPGHMQGHVFAGEHPDLQRPYVFLHADRMDAVTDRTRAVTDGRYRYIRNDMPNQPRLYPVAYAENIPMMEDIHALRASGKASKEQWQLVDDTKPAEELYDTASDPHEVRNLIDDPKYAEKLQELRAALTQWIAETGDLGMLPEGEMVRTQLWSGAESKPATAMPEVTRATDGTVTMTCATEGATIGYRCGGQGPWSIYSGPFQPEPGQSLTVVAHRIGYVPSGQVTVTTK